MLFGPESDCCPLCGCGTVPTDDVRERACPVCGKTAWDPFPKGAENEANYGPSVKSAIAYLVGPATCPATTRTVS